MKRLLLVFSFIALSGGSTLMAQAPDPVKWSCSVVYGNKDEATLVMTATIQDGWHVYSQHLPEGGPIKTHFEFDAASLYTLTGEVEEGQPIDYYDPNFEMQLKYFSHQAEFRQKIKRLSKSGGEIKGRVEYMVCDDHRCLPPVTVELSFQLESRR